MPEFVFANRSGLEMFEATSSSLPDLDWEKTLNENDRKLSYATFTQVLQQVRACPGGVGKQVVVYVGVVVVGCGSVCVDARDDACVC
jgi:chromate transport protein ChrA